LRGRLECTLESLCHFIQLALRVDDAQQPSRPVELDQRLGFFVIHPQPLGDRRLIVIGPLE
jgi:hypothetical protein